MASTSGERHYLEELAGALDQCVARIRALPRDQGLEAVRRWLVEVMETEQTVRQAHKLGSRFSVISAELHRILERFESQIKEKGDGRAFVPGVNPEASGVDDVVVYVYLYNAQGASFSSWQKLLTDNALFEHSVNRPIYANREQVTDVIGRKENCAQHAYLEIGVKRQDILSGVYPPLSDPYGFPLLRLRQGALRGSGCRTFFHNGKSYDLASAGSFPFGAAPGGAIEPPPFS